ncbi:hypothetical protein GCM10007939_06940 [Amylibacter marinus]|uniref:DUF1330 domain-containing protein n=1 Tax=Amylibacter marinus TaxID=1475483 RepID=A0ABQ5VSS1_9RHOB|nr:DUF1330 domain-containing protein [Amylibacter marinus]GLQ34411.1 hypothetical protein GCM10007939_06940 [Amylibacter marinus]
MAAYVIAQVDVTDPEAYVAYSSKTVEIAAQFGGKFLAKGGPAEQIEGAGRARNVIVEFPDVASAKAFYNAPEYQAILPIALAHSQRELVIVEGV